MMTSSYTWDKELPERVLSSKFSQAPYEVSFDLHLMVAYQEQYVPNVCYLLEQFNLVMQYGEEGEQN